MRLLLRTAWVVLISLVSCNQQISNADSTRIARFIEAYAPGGLFIGPFQGFKEWMLIPATRDSETAFHSNLRNRWEASEHAMIDSISDDIRLKPLKKTMHAFTRAFYQTGQLDLVLPDVASQLSPKFLTHHSFYGDSLLLLARRLLDQNDSLGYQMSVSGLEFNRLSRSIGFSDTLQYRRHIAARSHIVIEYMHFLEPPIQAFLLSSE